MLTNSQGFKRFFELYFEPVYRFVRKYTEEDAIAEIMSKGLSDLGVKKVFTSKTLYTADNTGKEYGQEDLRNAWVDELTLGGDKHGDSLLG